MTGALFLVGSIALVAVGSVVGRWLRRLAELYPPEPGTIDHHWQEGVQR